MANDTKEGVEEIQGNTGPDTIYKAWSEKGKLYKPISKDSFNKAGGMAPNYLKTVTTKTPTK